MRVTTAGVARNREGRYFVGKRKASKNLDPCWEFPGGKTDGDESPEDALKREFREEFGVNIEIGPLLCTGNFESATETYTLRAFSVTLKGTPECREHLTVDWKTLEEIEKIPFAPSDSVIIEALRQGRS